MIKLSLSQIAELLNIPAPQSNSVIEGISRDTRTIQPNNLYVAIKGEQFDGHDFTEIALQKGAGAALVDRKLNSAIPQLVVADTIKALGKISAYWRNQLTLPIVGVTGSNGKTTLKNMISAILQKATQPNAVLATEGNLNNHIGLPLMLARLSQHHRYAVIEMGMNHFGEIAYLTRLAKPTVAIINNAGAAHLEGVGDIAGVARAKGEIFEGLPPTGIAILNRDDAFFDFWKNAIPSQPFLSFGLDHAADITGTYSNQVLTIKTPKGHITVQLNLLGKHNAMNALAATAAAIALNIDLSAIQAGLESVQAAPGRMRVYRLPQNITLIDDTYNANPFSTRAAIDALSTFDESTVLLLGDMRELGDQATELHFATGQHAKKMGIQHLLTFGELSQSAKEGFGKEAQSFNDREQCLAALQSLLKPGTTVLIKGSRSMKMEYFVNHLVPKEELDHAH